MIGSTCVGHQYLSLGYMVQFLYHIPFMKKGILQVLSASEIRRIGFKYLIFHPILINIVIHDITLKTYVWISFKISASGELINSLNVLYRIHNCKPWVYLLIEGGNKAAMGNSGKQ